MSNKSFLITCLFLLFLVQFCPAQASQDANAGHSDSKKSSNAKKEKRLFTAELYGALCKECLLDLKREIKSLKGVEKTNIKKVENKEEGRRYAFIKVQYQSPSTTRDDLIEIIKFRDLYPSEIKDIPIK